MGVLNNSSVVAAQLEKVIPALPRMYEIEDSVITKVKRKGEIVSNRAARVTVKTRPGGTFGIYNPDGGDMGRGTATQYDVLTVSPSHFKISVEATKLAAMATDSSEKAVLNAIKEEMKNIMVEFKVQQDKAFFRNSTGLLGYVGKSTTPKQWYLGTSNFSAGQRFRVGQRLVVVDTTLASVRAGSPIVTRVDDANGIIYVDGDPTGLTDDVSTGSADGDKIYIEGQTFSASAAVTTVLNGLSTLHDDTQSGTYLSLNRANYPELWTPSVSCGSALLVLSQLRAALTKVMLALGSDAVQGLKVLLHPVQRDSYESLATAIQEIDRAKGGNDVDLLFSGSFNVAGVPTIQSINMDPTRIDFIHFDSLGRTVMEEAKMFEVGGTTQFPVYGTDGAPSAAQWFALTSSFQLFHENPRRGSFLKSLAVPSTYTIGTSGTV